jgi:Mn2+/Fe2+ NRAMP family transporter
MRNKTDDKNFIYRIALVITVIGSFVVCQSFDDQEFQLLVLITTTLSFIVAPFVAILNTLLVRKSHIEEHTPPTWLKWLSYAGIVYLVGFGAYAVYVILNM